MSYSLKINGKTYQLKDGFVIKDEITEELDSGTIKFTTIGKLADIQPFDSIYINGTNGLYVHQLANGIDTEQYAFGLNNALEGGDYDYTVSTFSETKDLERITLPTIRITQNLNVEDRFSVADKIQEFCNTYIPKIKVMRANFTGWEYVAKYRLDDALLEKFANVECPEMQWNNPTLKEVLNGLLSVKDCMVTLKDNIISFIDLRDRTNANPIDVSKLSSSKVSQSSADFATDLTLNLSNAIGKTPTRNVEKGTFRVDAAEMDTSNMSIITQHPIYNIRKLKITYYGYRQGFGTHAFNWNYLQELDITNRVKEDNDFNTLRSRPNIYQEVYPDDYRVFNVHYKRGGNSVSGFADNYPIASANHYVFNNLINAVLNLPATGKIALLDGETASTFVKSNVREIMYEIEYDSVDENAINVGRYLPLARTGVNRIFDNQTSSYVDMRHQSFFEYAKINRLSNKILMITGEYESIEELPQLGDYIEEYILFQREVAYYDDKIMFVGYLTPNFILRDWFTGVNSKRRNWQIVSGDEASIRNDIYKYYVEFSFRNKRDILTEFMGSNASVITFNLVSALNSYTDELAIRYALVQTRAEDNSFIPSNSGRYLVELFKEVEGKSLCFNLGFDDNFYAGTYCEIESSRYLMHNYRYTDELGRFKSVTITLASQVDAGEGTIFNPIPSTFNNYPSNIITSQQFNNLRDMSFRRPLYEGAIGDNIYTPVNAKVWLKKNFVYKDNAEIYRATVQFEFCADTENIVVTDKMISLSGLFNEANYGDVEIKTLTFNTPAHKFEEDGVISIEYEGSLIVNELIDKKLISLDIEQPVTDAYDSNFIKFDRETGKLTYWIHPRYFDDYHQPDDIYYAVTVKYLKEVTPNLVIYLYTGSDKYHLNDETPLGSVTNLYDLEVVNNGANTEIRLYNHGTSTIATFNNNEKIGICTEDGDLLLGINFNSNNKRGLIFASMLQDRDDSVYTDNIERVEIGKMDTDIVDLVSKYAEVKDRELVENEYELSVTTDQYEDGFYYGTVDMLVSASTFTPYKYELEGIPVGYDYEINVVDTALNKKRVTINVYGMVIATIGFTLKVYGVSNPSNPQTLVVRNNRRAINVSTGTSEIGWHDNE